MGALPHLLVLDSERPTDSDPLTYQRRLGELLTALLAQVVGSGSPKLPVLAVAVGTQLRLFDCDESERSIQRPFVCVRRHPSACRAGRGVRPR